jgi:disulfide bond formation protein DsbB
VRSSSQHIRELFSDIDSSVTHFLRLTLRNNGMLLKYIFQQFQAHELCLKLDKLIGLAMLVVASIVFLYYTVWTLLMVMFQA